MPNKHNADRRHHFGKMKFKIRNWACMKPAFGGAQPDAVGDGRGDRQMAAPPRRSPGGQAHYSDMAIETALMLRLTFHLPLRQTEGFMESIFALLGVTVSAPDHSTLSRRATTLPSVSLGGCRMGPARTDRQHGIESVRRWRMAAGKARRARTPKLAQTASRR